MLSKLVALFFFCTLCLWSNAQNVGIGTTTPTNKLSVSGKADFSDSVGIATASPLGQLHVKSFNSNTIDQQQLVDNNSSTGALSIWQSFRAGITGKLTRIDVSAGSPTSGIPANVTIKIYSGAGTTGALLSTTTFTFQDPITFKSISLSTYANVIAGNTYTVEFSTAISNTAWLSTNPNNPYLTGMSSAQPNIDLLFRTYVMPLVDALMVSNGKVGIGSASPSAKLDVIGNVKIADGTQGIGKILTSDANGLASWQVAQQNIGTGTAIGNTTYWNGTTWVTNSSNIYNNGTNVGIGTTTPSVKLDLVGKIKIADGTQGAGKVLTSDANGLATWVTPVTGGLGVGSADGNTVYWNGTSWVTNSSNIYNNGTNVGIGTTSPSAKLDLAGNIKITDGTEGAGKVLTSDANGLASWAPVTAVNVWGLAGNAGTSAANFLGTTDDQSLRFGTKNTEKMILDTLGNLGIGTSSPAGKVHIKSYDNTLAAIDQQQTVALGINNGPSHWQSFTAGVTGRLTRVDLSVRSPTNNASEPGTIKIYNGEGNGGTLLSATAVFFSNPEGFKSFNLSTFVNVIAGNKYTIEFSTPSYTTFWVHSNGNNPYPGGLTDYAPAYPNVDFVFKTYVTTVDDALVVSNGLVGIGTNNPTSKLHIKSGSLVCDNATQRFFVNGSPKWDIGGFAGGYEISRSGVAVDFFINGNNGNIGISNTSPLAPLHVGGSPYLTGSLARSYFHQGSGPDILSNTAASGGIKVIADGYFWANGGGFVATSDKRIKNIKGLTNTKNDLDLLNKIEVTDYTYIDKINNGSAPQKKVIAQQLQSIYPEAVNTSKGVIPNVFDVAGSTIVVNGQTIITTNKPHTFASGDQVKLLLEDAGEKMVAVTVISPTTFSVNEKIGSKIFVYGKQVNDLLNVDYDAVSMLNVSATQELYKMIRELTVENEKLKAESDKQKSANDKKFAAFEEKMGQLLLSIKQCELVTK